jgi:DNA-binding XRE family transcriptional regulator
MLHKTYRIQVAKEVRMKLRAWRAQRVLSQKKLADRAGLSVFTIVAIENGKQLPRPETAQKLAEALGVNPLEIDEIRAAMERVAEGPKKDLVGNSPTR